MGILARRRSAARKEAREEIKATPAPQSVSNEVEKEAVEPEKQPVARQEGWEKKQGKKHGAK
jgi:hypothetical protein